MNLNFCTIFDKNYLAKGIALIHSLTQVCSNFKLYVFAFDSETLSILKQLNLSNVILVSLKDFESEELLKLKESRTSGEYCWTCKGPAIKYCFKKFNLEICTYIDSDLFFYRDPKYLIEKMGDNDVMLTPHNFIAEHDLSSTRGFYSAQWLTFKNTIEGNKVLDWWTQSCIVWCFAQVEEDRFGDQKYLEKFTIISNSVFSLTLFGNFLGPWNASKIRLKKINGEIFTSLRYSSAQESLYFYHFHNLSNQNFLFFKEFLLGPYFLPKSVRIILYKPYLSLLRTISSEIYKIDNTLDSLGSKKVDYSYIRTIVHFFRNIFNKNKIFWF